MSNSPLVSDRATGLIRVFQYSRLISIPPLITSTANLMVNSFFYSKETSRPFPGDIEFLTLCDLIFSIPGTKDKADSATSALREFTKAIAFLENPVATSGQIQGTNSGERNVVNVQTQANFLFQHLNATNSNIGDAMIDYVNYLRDFKAIQDQAYVDAMLATLRDVFLNINLDSFEQHTIGALASMLFAFSSENDGLIHEGQIATLLEELEKYLDSDLHLYYDLGKQSGKVWENAILIDAFMARNAILLAKCTITGVIGLQRSNGSFQEVFGSESIMSSALTAKYMSAALTRISDEGL